MRNPTKLGLGGSIFLNLLFFGGKKMSEFITTRQSYKVTVSIILGAFSIYLGSNKFDYKIFVALCFFYFVDIFLQIYEQKKVPFHKVIVGNNNSIDAENSEAEK